MVNVRPIVRAKGNSSKFQAVPYGISNRVLQENKHWLVANFVPTRRWLQKGIRERTLGCMSYKSYFNKKISIYKIQTENFLWSRSIESCINGQVKDDKQL